MFLNHCYDFTYVHILKPQTRDEAVEAKEAFEEYFKSCGVDIKDYHDENIIFRIVQFINHCKDIN